MAEITKTEKREDWQLHRRWHKRAAGQGESDKKDRCQRGRGERRQCPVQPIQVPGKRAPGVPLERAFRKGRPQRTHSEQEGKGAGGLETPGWRAQAGRMLKDPLKNLLFTGPV